MTSVLNAGFVLGWGLGGFFDGIVFHQLLQWHHVVCYEPHCRTMSVEVLRQQNFYDGLFHLGTLAFTVFGAFGVFRAARSGSIATTGHLVASAIAGWGAFHVIEGLLNHQILGLHHVLPQTNRYWFAADMAYLGMGAAAMAAGVWMAGKK